MRRGWALVAGGLMLALAGCGASATTDASGQEADVPAATEAALNVGPVTEAVAVGDVSIADQVVGEPSDSAPTEVSAITDPQAPTTTPPLGGVTIDDPLPPQADSVIDPGVAEAAIRYAYQHWILVDLDKDLRASLIENGEENVDGLHDGLQAVRSLVEFARFEVEEVRFTDAEHADVTFRIRWMDGPSPYFPNSMSGTAIYQNGSWRLGGATLCVLALGAGQSCAANGNNPVPAAALQLFGVPAGYEWNGDQASRDVLMVPGAAYWSRSTSVIDANGMLQQIVSEISVSAEILVGAAAMSADNVALILASGRFGLPDGTAEMLGDQPARIRENRDGTVEFVYLRPDDVVVRLYVSSITTAQIRALAASIGNATTIPVAVAGADEPTATLAAAEG